MMGLVRDMGLGRRLAADAAPAYAATTRTFVTFA